MRGCTRLHSGEPIADGGGRSRFRHNGDVGLRATNRRAPAAGAARTAGPAQGQQVLALETQLRLAHEEAQQWCSQMSQHHIQLLGTEEHRPVLEQALRDVLRELFVISPWMNRRACNDTLCDLIASGLRRAIRVIISYRIGENPRNSQDTKRQEANAWSVLNVLRGCLMPQWSERLDVYRTHATHQMILPQDDVLEVHSSFNWLSYSGQCDSEYRSETGTLLRTQEDLVLLRAGVMQTLRDAERVRLRPLTGKKQCIILRLMFLLPGFPLKRPSGISTRMTQVGTA